MLAKIALPNGTYVHPKFMTLDAEQMVCMSFSEFQSLIAYYMSIMKIVKNTSLSRGIKNVNEMLSLLVADPVVMSGEMEATMANRTNPILEEISEEQLKKEGYAPLEEHLRKAAFQQIASIRKQRGLSQSDLAQKIGIDQSRLSRLERHPERIPADLLVKLAQALNIDEIIIPK